MLEKESQIQIPAGKHGIAPNQFEAAYLSANKLITQFVGIPAMKHTVMDDSIFQEAWARYLGEPSPACAHWVGLDFKP